MTFRVLSVAVLATLAFPASASDTDTLDKVVVTANRAPVAVRDVLAPVEVIDRDEIERSQARSLPDLLRGRAGISIGNQGGLGKLTTLFVRGSESDHVLVLVDGVRMGSATSGLVSFQDIPVELIDRIEIVRGPRSSLYDSEAIGGVIQIFTRRDSSALAPRFSIGAGSRDTYEASAGVGGKVGRGWFGADYSRQQTGGYDACRGSLTGGCFANEPDRDGYTRDAASLRGGVRLSDAWAVDANVLRAQGDNRYDGYFNRSKVLQQVSGAGAAWTPSSKASLKLQVGRDRDASDNYHDAAFIGAFDTHRDTATLQGDFSLAAAHRLSAGLEWQRDSVDSDTAYVLTRRIDRAGYLQYLGDFGRIDLEASARHDDNEQFGGHSTGNIAVGADIAPAWRLTAGAGTAFKSPTFNELYYPFGFGNPGLRPERSRSVEAGIAWAPGADAGLRLDVYRTHVDDLIAYSSSTFRPENIQRARLSGAELSGHATVAGWIANGSISRVEPQNRTGAVTTQLPRRATASARVDLDRAFGAFRLGITASGEAARYDDLANLRRLGGFGTVDLRGEYAFNADWRVQARVENLFDRRYETVEFYRQPTRGLFVTLRYAPSR
ncbi:TonB-dependent vitamin B12 receptor [Cognatilysobacter lacus]|uniref:TonB-dependent vitamin B12 receptor n=1 Tax=Cognatilysobacter lacus TaxID=1643323 RepID=A0A5D8YW29_9GAMM|nr:TonB-dependent vitamin B12 receptor [Lysobacter lacus]TZF86701.1 TonB-dependent vitamin B12 receptor [Lysobacter lacus]